MRAIIPNCKRMLGLAHSSARPGPMFADAELIGIPHRLVLSDRGLDAGIVEYKGRTAADKQDIPAGQIMDFIKQRIHI